MQKPRVAAGSRISEYLGRCEIFVRFGPPARSAATMLQRRGGGLQGGSPFSEPFLIFFLCSSWIKIKHITKIFWPALATE